jgi:hypothetical protein
VTTARGRLAPAQRLGMVIILTFRFLCILVLGLDLVTVLGNS